MAYQDIAWDDVKPLDDVTVWTGSRGQGGIVTTINAAGIEIISPAQQTFTFLKADVTHLTIDAPLPADECLDYNPDECSGPVEMWHSGGMNGRSWPRCVFHGKQRLERYENSIEKYADSDVEPSWFDPSYAGERWNDDY